MKFESESLRPRGTVEVSCSHPNCGHAWWVDPLDPRLPGPFDCGADHDAERIFRVRMEEIRLRYGFVASSWKCTGPGKKDAPPSSCASVSPTSGVVIFTDRTRDQRGYLEWSHLSDLANTDAAAARIEWDQTKWPPELHEWSGSSPKVYSGQIQWVGYESEGTTVRRYTFVPCARVGCSHRVMVDVEKPDHKPDMWAVGSWGGGEMFPPPWWGNRTFVCEDGLKSNIPVPCKLARSETLAQFEQASQSRWVRWETTKSGGAMLFYWPGAKVFGAMVYEGDQVFETPGRISQVTQWGALKDVIRVFQNLEELSLYEELSSFLEDQGKVFSVC